MRTAAICNTPYQVLNMVNLFFHDNSYGDVDLYLIDRFTTSHKLYGKLKDVSFIKNVYYIMPNPDIVDTRWSTILKMISPKRYKEHYKIDEWKIIQQDYDYLFYGDLEPLGRIIEDANPNVKAYVYDDGWGSYFGNILFDYKSKKVQLVEKIFGVGVSRSNIQGLFVNGKNISKSNVSKNIYQLPSMNDPEFAEFAKDVFDYKDNDSLRNHRFLIMDYPMERIKEYNGYDLINVLKIYEGNNCLYRIHPCSQSKKDIDIAVDNTYNLWELDCQYSITDDHVLVGYYSTSQFMPKIIADKEPYLILTYKLMLCPEGAYRYNGYEQFIRLVQECYRDKSKIFIPDSENELIETLIYLKKQINC